MTTTLRPRHLVLTTAFALLLGACSASSASVAPAASSAPGAPATAPGGQASAPAGADPTSAPAGAADACALLTRAEVEAAFKETMQVPVASVDHGDAMCSWTHEANGLDLTVKISSKPSTAAAIKAIEGAYGGVGVDVPGVGDAAFDAAGVLEFVKGTTLVIIATGDGPGIISDDNFKGLAKTAAGRI